MPCRIRMNQRAGERDSLAMSAPPTSSCARCGTVFECGSQAGKERCWCAAFPALPAPQPGKACYCPRCLKDLLDAKPDSESVRLP
ncbi:MAG TPA: cysteine-rich CWC family protein [Burkholderiales bacterium]